MPLPNFTLRHGSPPDQCEHAHDGLVEQSRKALAEIEASLSNALCLKQLQSTPRKLVRETFGFREHVENDKKLARGLYVLFDGKQATLDNAFYVGISNDVPKRLADHLSAASHHKCSLLFLLLKQHLSADELVKYDEVKRRYRAKTRAELFEEYRCKCEEIRDHLLVHCSVLMQPVRDVVTLHVLEALAALKFATGPWNSFRPH